MALYEANGAGNLKWAQAVSWLVEGKQPAAAPKATDDVFFPKGFTGTMKVEAAAVCRSLKVHPECKGTLAIKGKSLSIGNSETPPEKIALELGKEGIFTSTEAGAEIKLISTASG